jgi:SPP1 gp7 family putative phage head morphogenesis protein
MAYELDIFVRQQIFLEAVKNDEATKFNDMRTAVITVLTSLLLSSGYDSFADMPRRTLNGLIAKANKRLTSKFKKIGSGIMRRMRDIMMAEITVSGDLFGRYAGRQSPVTLRQASTNRRKLWASLTNGLIPGSGTTPAQLLSTFFTSSLRDVGSTVRRAFADGLSPQDALRAIRGTAANGFKDGLINKFRNHYSAMTDTLIQHVSSFVHGVLGKLVSDEYEWVSVIDSATTDVCRSRDGKVYKWGKGPMPPAHYRCRSTTKPYRAEEPTSVQSFFSWLSGQPASVQDELVGRAQGVAVRAGTMGASDFPRFASNRRLTPGQYIAKRDVMLT